MRPTLIVSSARAGAAASATPRNAATNPRVCAIVSPTSMFDRRRLPLPTRTVYCIAAAAEEAPLPRDNQERAKSGFWRVLGPGLITGASDDDPSGIATYSQVGAQFGYGLAWTMLLTYPLMCAMQEIAARIGRVTGAGIAGNIREHYSPTLLRGIVLLLIGANTINLGADLGAMADALRLLIGGPSKLYVIGFAVLCAALEIFLTYQRYVAILKWSTIALLAYVAAVMVVGVPWGDLLHNVFVP